MTNFRHKHTNELFSSSRLTLSLSRSRHRDNSLTIDEARARQRMRSRKEKRCHSFAQSLCKLSTMKQINHRLSKVCSIFSFITSLDCIFVAVSRHKLRKRRASERKKRKKKRRKKRREERESLEKISTRGAKWKEY